MMARSYKRDKNGRFASTGGSGGGAGKAAASLAKVGSEVKKLRARTNASAGSPTLMRKKGVITTSNLYIPPGIGSSSPVRKKK